MLCGVDHDGVHPGRGDAHFAGLERAFGQAFLDLHDDGAAAVTCSKRQRLRVQVSRFVFEADVAVLVGGAGSHDGDMNRERLVAQPLTVVDGHHFSQVFLGGIVHLAATVARVAYSAQAHMADEARASSTNLAHELARHTARQDVGLDFVVQGELLHRR